MSKKRTALLEVLNATKTYHVIPALRSISFTTAPWDVVGLLGPNGSGKSTTVTMIVGLLSPSRGRVHWRGTNIHDQLLAFHVALEPGVERLNLSEALN